MKYSEANEKVKELSSHLSFKANEDDHSIGLCSDGKEIVGIYDASSNTVDAFYTLNAVEVFDYRAIKLLVELHETLVEDRKDEKKFRVFISNGMNRQRLVRLQGGYVFCDENGVKNYSAVSYRFKDVFTESEVNRLRNNGDFNISWDKALEEVPGDEVSDD
ncbi:hypothetical protein [Lactiplantibacillus mudanjiangensis]|uniref:Uncharacterized protein n=1 Tax=Lactiplantibacillus mudanjiangensis TaxID=1296538 RepID=A0A660E080_9LACO|nr:hypothetical protein [Lactiplantibacillus mudanjiangensis]VDG25833.1 hypothetical protein MUDAN_IGPPGNFN_01278 [Lactiplantibacillus mudanjiangensis]VDG28886.1 hypothetical protein MUDAN_MDHGFNIF_03287 [Lactiplantibacillus mudanjiangensis]